MSIKFDTVHNFTINSLILNLTNAFIEAKSPLLRANIEKKMTDYEKQLADLQTTISRILLERGHEFTANDILAFIAGLLKGDPADKAYQRKIIDNLVYMVYIYDDDIIKTIGFLDLGVDKSIEKIRLDETNEIIERIKKCSSTIAHSQPKTAEKTLCGFSMRLSCKLDSP